MLSCQRVSNLSRCKQRVLLDSSRISISLQQRRTNRIHFQRRCISTRNSEGSDEHHQSDVHRHDESIFTSSAESTWNEIFRQDPRPSSVKPFSSEPKPVRRQTITERESKVITGMLDMIFNKRRPDNDVDGSDSPATKNKNEQAGLGGGGHIDDLVGRLKRHPRPLRWAKEPTADLLDQKKEQMMSCNSDKELLQWAQREIFDESKRYEEGARKAIEIASQEKPASLKHLPSLQSPVYPQVIAHLMRTFRDHYNDPNLALFIFHHTRKISIISYVFGCSTEVYNEFIKTRWECFRDLQGVYDTIDEMKVNGVPLDSVTQKLIENIRHDVGGLELRPDASQEAQQTVWGLLNKIEHMVVSQTEKKAEPKLWDQWKSEVLSEGDFDSDWSFDNWLPEEREISTRKRKALNTRRALSRA